MTISYFENINAAINKEPISLIRDYEKLPIQLFMVSECDFLQLKHYPCFSKDDKKYLEFAAAQLKRAKEVCTTTMTKFITTLNRGHSSTLARSRRSDQLVPSTDQFAAAIADLFLPPTVSKIMKPVLDSAFDAITMLLSKEHHHVKNNDFELLYLSDHVEFEGQTARISDFCSGLDYRGFQKGGIFGRLVANQYIERMVKTLHQLDVQNVEYNSAVERVVHSACNRNLTPTQCSQLIADRLVQVKMNKLEVGPTGTMLLELELEIPTVVEAAQLGSATSTFVTTGLVATKVVLPQQTIIIDQTAYVAANLKCSRLQYCTHSALEYDICTSDLVQHHSAKSCPILTNDDQTDFSSVTSFTLLHTTATSNCKMCQDDICKPIQTADILFTNSKSTLDCAELHAHVNHPMNHIEYYQAVTDDISTNNNTSQYYINTINYIVLGVIALFFISKKLKFARCPSAPVAATTSAPVAVTTNHVAIAAPPAQPTIPRTNRCDSHTSVNSC